jgi:hypothetical protein
VYSFYDILSIVEVLRSRLNLIIEFDPLWYPGYR